MSRPDGPHVSAGDFGRFLEPLAGRSPRQGWLERGLRGLIGAGCRIVDWQLEVEGLSDLPRAPGRWPAAGCVVAPAPHRAWVEPFLLAWAWPADAARLVWLADGRTVTRSWWRRRLLPRLGIIPIAREVGGPQGYAELAARALQAGAAVVVFPEVGRASEPDRTRRISAGFAYLARYAGAPVIPVVIGGTHRIARGSRYSLQVLPPLDAGPPDPHAFGPGAREQVRALREQYAQCLNARLPDHTARADRRAPERERWTWLARLFS
jgi:1-acyl-sn-glycerol-3-phosphate acyltransferase